MNDSTGPAPRVQDRPAVKRRVLIVDGAGGSGAGIAAALRDRGCEVTVAAGVKAAAETLAAQIGEAASGGAGTADLAVVVAAKDHKHAFACLTAGVFASPKEFLAAMDAGAPASDTPAEGLVRAVNVAVDYFQLRAERAAADSALRESESLLRSILDNATAVIYAKDRAGRYVFINKTFESIFGLSNDSIKGKLDHDIFDPEFADKFRKNDLAVIHSGQPVEIEETAPHADGPHYYISVKFPIFNSAGEVRGLCGISTDITDRKRAEERLAQIQRMEAVGHLTGGMAHDFNNLHTIILGNLELIEELLERDSPAHDYAKRAIEAARRASLLTERLLAYSRKQVLQPESTDVNGLVLRLASMVESSFGESYDVRTVLAGDVRHAHVDPARLEDALFGIVANARDAMPDGGIVTIETRNVFIDEFDAIRAEVARGDYVLISVSDTGVGMSPEIKSRMFDPFFTTKPVGAGTGLGLSMVQGFVMQSGGRVMVESEPGKGTKVRLLLPQTGESRIKGGHVLQPAAVRPGGGETILVVAEDAAIRRSAVGILEDMGYRVFEAVDAVTALAVTAAAPKIDLVVTDLNLPGPMSGRELAAAVCQRRPGAKALYIACGSAPPAGAAENGARVVEAPFRRVQLESCVRDVLDAVPLVLEERAVGS